MGQKKAKKGPNLIFGFGTENMVGFNCGRGVVTGLWPRSCYYVSEWFKIKKERIHFKILNLKRISIDTSTPELVYNSNSKLVLNRKLTDPPL